MLNGDEKEAMRPLFVLKRRSVTIFYTKIVSAFRAKKRLVIHTSRCPLGEVIPTRDFSHQVGSKARVSSQYREVWGHGAIYRYRLLRFVIIQPLLR